MSWLLYSARRVAMLLSFHSLVSVEVLMKMDQSYFKRMGLN